MAEKTLYVDSNYGNDSNAGDLLRPLKTLQEAYDQASEGSFIVLQSGFGSYGSLAISKSISIVGAYGANPSVDVFTVTNGQCYIENVNFSDASLGIRVVNNAYGSLSVKNCEFVTADIGIELNGVNFVSVHRNTFNNFRRAILISQAEEVNISSNVFNDGFRSIEVSTIQRLDIWRNTIYGASAFSSGIVPDVNLRAVYKTITSLDIASKSLALPGFSTENDYGYDVAVNVVNGPSFEYGKDYIVNNTGSLVEWDGLGLDGELKIGDVLRVLYSEDVDPGSGTAISAVNIIDPNSTIDSNNITGTTGSDIAMGVFFSGTPFKIRYNNFYKTTMWYNASPSDDTGNFSDDPLYENPGVDFRLQAGSPSIDRGDPNRWSNIYDEIIDPASPLRENDAPFNRDIDRDGMHRFKSDASGDVGAYEYFSGGYVGDPYVDEQGYDLAFNGSQSTPFGTLDRGFSFSPGDDVFVKINPVGSTGTSFVINNKYGRYRTQNLAVSAKDLVFGGGSKYDVVYLYPSYPAYSTGAVFVTPTGSDISGDGSQGNSYRTIGKALSDPETYVIVEPGFYPKFTGVAGKNVIGIPKTYTIDNGIREYEYNPNDWDKEDVTKDSCFCYFDNSDPQSVGSFPYESYYKSIFQISGLIELGGVVNLNEGAFEMRLTQNPLSVPIPAFVSVYLKRSSGQLEIKFRIKTPTSAYTFTNVEPVTNVSAYKNISLKININGTKAIVVAKNSYFSKQKTMHFDSDPGNMRVFFGSTGPGVVRNELRNVLVRAQNFTAGSSSTLTKIRRKVIGLVSDPNFGTS